VCTFSSPTQQTQSQDNANPVSVAIKHFIFLMTASKQSQDGTQFHRDCLEAVIKTGMKLTNAEYTVENS
jgi:hypothetical protein